MTREDTNIVDHFRESLSPFEQQRYDYYVIVTGRSPSSMWELMMWSIEAQQRAAADRQSILGMVGL